MTAITIVSKAFEKECKPITQYGRIMVHIKFTRALCYVKRYCACIMCMHMVVVHAHISKDGMRPSVGVTILGIMAAE